MNKLKEGQKVLVKGVFDNFCIEDTIENGDLRDCSYTLEAVKLGLITIEVIDE